MPQQDNEKLAEDLVNAPGLQNLPLAIVSRRTRCPASSNLPMPCRNPQRMAAPDAYPPVAYSG